MRCVKCPCVHPLNNDTVCNRRDDTFSIFSSTSTCVNPRLSNDEVGSTICFSSSITSSAVSGLLLKSKCSKLVVFATACPKILPTFLKLKRGQSIGSVYSKHGFIIVIRQNGYLFLFFYSLRPRSNIFNPFVLIMRLLNAFALSSPDIPFHCIINTRNVSLTHRDRIIRVKSTRRNRKTKQKKKKKLITRDVFIILSRVPTTNRYFCLKNFWTNPAFPV